MHYKGFLRKGLRTAGEITSGVIGMYGTAKALGTMGGELFAGMQAARGLMTAASVAAPLALAL